MQVETASQILTDVIDDLRYERYVKKHSGVASTVIQDLYYALRPLMPAGIRKHLHRIHLNDWQKIPFPAWPVDTTVETLSEHLMMLALQHSGVQRIPFTWFWPDGYSGCLMLTHDVETRAGRDFCATLIDIDEAYGMKSSFQIVPEERYEVTAAFLNSLRARGQEINIHGLNHDSKLFRDRKTFLQRVRKINQYAKEYGASGFRSPILYRNLEWYRDFDFSYDMSVPNVAHLDPQRGGCCTVMPYFVGHVLELPLTTTQDWSLFNVLQQNSIDLWKQQIDLVLEKHGLLSFNIHPDYMIDGAHRRLYEKLLEHLRNVCADRNVWIALPGEVDRWWRDRLSDSLSEQAVLAYASVENGQIVYEVLPSPSGRGQGTPLSLWERAG